jgi:hypothetical protein
MRVRWIVLAPGLLLGSALGCTSPISTRPPADASPAQPDSLPAPDLPVPADTAPIPDLRAPADTLPVPDLPAPADTLPVPDLRVPADTAPIPDLRAPADTLPVPDLPAAADTAPGIDATPGAHCAEQTVHPLLMPVWGTVRGPTVEGEVCDNGVGTYFLGPEDHAYDQDFFTNTWLDAPYSPTGYDRSQIYGFRIRKPANAVSAQLWGGVYASAAEVGTYDSATNCGYLDFEVTLPVPPGVICTAEFPPCDPGCEGVGEMWVCMPAPGRLHYSARPSAVCGTDQDPPRGSWVLTETWVSDYIPHDGFLHHQTHGNLTATLVNLADPTDSVVLNLDF